MPAMAHTTRFPTPYATIVFALAAAQLACKPCHDGETQSCDCAYGRDGAQTCSSDNDGWNACECSGNDGANSTTAPPSTSDPTDPTDGDDTTDDDNSTDPTDPAGENICTEWEYAGAWSGDVGPGCYLHPTVEAWADVFAYVWSTEPSFLCQAQTTVTSCLGEKFDGYWYDHNDDAVLLLDATSSQLNQAAPGASIVLFAHEWGHVNQAALGEIAGCNPTTPPPQVELEADCYAGFASAVGENGTLYDSAFTMFSSFCGIFDPAHGTCDQRWCAYAAGYESARQNVEQVCDNPLGFASSVCPAIAVECS